VTGPTYWINMTVSQEERDRQAHSYTSGYHIAFYWVCQVSQYNGKLIYVDRKVDRGTMKGVCVFLRYGRAVLD